MGSWTLQVALGIVLGELVAPAAVTCEINAATPTPALQTVTLSVKSATGTGTIQFSWEFGDGSAATPYSTATTATHVYSKPGHYAVLLRAKDATGAVGASSTTQMVHYPLPTSRPTSSSPILFDGTTNRVWVVNPDSDTVTAIDASTLTKLFEVPVGVHPRTLARAPDGTIWVANQDSATITVVGTTGVLLQTIPLPAASQPYGLLFTPDGAAAFVSLQGTGRVGKLNPATRAWVGQVDVGPDPRGLAVTPDSSRLLVTRFISPRDRGEVVEIAPGPFAVVRTFALATDPGPDTERSSRGVPNYLNSITVTPDGRRAWVPSKKDNTSRGLVRDGLPLTFESTVRTIVSQIDLTTQAEGTRVDFNDRDMASVVQFSRHGDLAFIATQGTNTIEVLDAYAEDRTVALLANVGLACQGLTLDLLGNRLFVQCFLGRSVEVYDVSGVVDFTTNSIVKLATIPTVAVERLTAQELQGKRIFYNAADRRMNRDGYISCASCHLDGGGDGRVWDFTDRGEGLRNTTDLRGRRGTGHGPVHWTANFDEIQDFEHDMRGPFKGSGFMADGDFHSGTRDTTLGTPKAGVSADLDALAAYVTSLKEAPPSPFRNPDGTLTQEGQTGREIFARLGCATCHAGPDFTDSSLRILHDVGTIKATSGQRLSGPLPGIDTPTLKGVWQTAPYLHDGSADTLDDVLNATAPGGRHGDIASLSPTERRQLVAYLLQIDESEARVVRQDPAGLVSLEAEHPSARHDAGGHAWIPDPAGTAMECMPNIGAQVDAGYAAASPRLDYHVLFTKTGTHYIWVRGHGATAADNSVHVGLDGQAPTTCQRVGPFPSTEAWMSTTMDATVARFDVPTAGVHTVSVWMREDGFSFDKLVVTTDPHAVVSGAGPSESPTVDLPAAPSAQAAGSSGSGGSCGALGLEALLLMISISTLKRWRTRR